MAPAPKPPADAMRRAGIALSLSIRPFHGRVVAPMGSESTLQSRGFAQ